MGKRAAIGIDIGGSKTLCTLIDEKFKVRDEIKFKTSPAEGRKPFVKELVASLRSLKKIAKKEDLKVIGVGCACAGAVDEEKGVVVSSPNILYLENYNLGRLIRDKVGLEIVLGNDVQLGIYAEHQLGAAEGFSQVLGFFFGTGVGGAAIINGKLYTGASGMGGQIGSVLAHSIGTSDTEDTHGTVDRVASKAAIGGAALAMAAKQWAPQLYKEVGTDLANVTWGALATAIKKGDKSIRELFRSRLRVVGIALSSVVNFANPEIVVLGGGMTEEMPKLVLTEVEAGLRENLVPEVNKVLKVRVAKLKNRAGVFGGAKRAFEVFG